MPLTQQLLNNDYLLNKDYIEPIDGGGNIKTFADLFGIIHYSISDSNKEKDFDNLVSYSDSDEFDSEKLISNLIIYYKQINAKLKKINNRENDSIGFKNNKIKSINGYKLEFNYMLDIKIKEFLELFTLKENKSYSSIIKPLQNLYIESDCKNVLVLKVIMEAIEKATNTFLYSDINIKNSIDNLLNELDNPRTDIQNILKKFSITESSITKCDIKGGAYSIRRKSKKTNSKNKRSKSKNKRSKKIIK